MAKTEVILTHNVVGLGGESDHVKVAAGYARNFLFPQGLAIPLTAANKRRLEVLRQRRAEREAKELSTMSELGQALSKLTLVIKVKTGDDGKLFGSITAGTIADELKHQFDAIVDKRRIHLAHVIKNVGDHEAELRLHHQVQITLKVRVESTNPPPTPAEIAAAEPKDQGRGREGRRDRGAAPAKEEPKAEGKPERKARAAKAE
jgi:large subunit ribosomal protein L9